jgi:hypothetical protein
VNERRLPVVVLVHYKKEIRDLVRTRLAGRVDLFEANTLEAAARLLSDHPDVRVLAIGSVRPSGHIDADAELRQFIEERAGNPELPIVAASGMGQVREWMLVWGASVVCDHSQWHTWIARYADAPRPTPSQI